MTDKKGGTAVADEEDELLMDTSQMSEEKRQTMEIAEAAREKDYKFPSFGSQLFMGTFAKDMIFPFPVQDTKDAVIGDDMVAKVKKLLEEHLDPELVDETRTIPQEVIRGFVDLG
ncbi:MAG: DNA polymerase II, partial [Chlamydiia bacterium]|nr:DNA polymerase II [Chlamydiia bacterium]